MKETGQNVVPLMCVTETLKCQSSDVYEILLGWTNQGNLKVELVECTRKKRSAYRVLVGKPEGKRPLGRTGHQQVDKIKKDFNKQNGMDSSGSGEGELAGSCEHANES